MSDKELSKICTNYIEKDLARGRVIEWSSWRQVYGHVWHSSRGVKFDPRITVFSVFTRKILSSFKSPRNLPIIFNTVHMTGIFKNQKLYIYMFLTLSWIIVNRDSLTFLISNLIIRNSYRNFPSDCYLDSGLSLKYQFLIFISGIVLLVINSQWPTVELCCWVILLIYGDSD